MTNPYYARHMTEAEFAALSGEAKQRMYSDARDVHYDASHGIDPTQPRKKTRKGAPTK